jgi:hypothetical protein
VWTAAAGSVAGWMGAGALWIFVDVVRFASRTASSRSGEAIWPRLGGLTGAHTIPEDVFRGGANLQVCKCAMTNSFRHCTFLKIFYNGTNNLL